MNWDESDSGESGEVIVAKRQYVPECRGRDIVLCGSSVSIGSLQVTAGRNSLRRGNVAKLPNHLSSQRDKLRMLSRHSASRNDSCRKIVEL